MKTGSELVNFKNFNAQNKQSITDFQTLKSREINDVVATSDDLFDNEVDEETPMDDKQSEDELEIDGGINLKHYYSYPYGIGTAPNESKILRFSEFKQTLL